MLAQQHSNSLESMSKDGLGQTPIVATAFVADPENRQP